jgi:hypothetical protein
MRKRAGACGVLTLIATGCFVPDSDAPMDGSESSTGETGSTSGGSTSDATTEVEMSSDATTSPTDASESSSDGSSGTTTAVDPPAAVQLRWPWNGATTGSVWATDPGLAVVPRRPTFRWTASRGAYQIQIDDSCESPGFAACEFESPEVDEVVDAPTFTPADDLAVSTTAPVGRRYYWRVRACDGELCSEWSAVRYVDVARQIKDYDGDGFSDLLFTAYVQDDPEINEGAAYVYYGSADGVPSTPSRILDNPADQESGLFGTLATSPGDVNGDGFGDLVVNAWTQDLPELDEGAIYVYLGGPNGIGSTPSLTIDNPDDEAGARFGLGLRSVGDVDADGFADVLVGAMYSDHTIEDGGVAYLFRGSPDGLAAEPSVTIPRPADAEQLRFGEALGGGGDLDGDGYADAIIASYIGGGEAFVYRGGTEGLAMEPELRLGNPTPDADAGFGVMGWIADVNGDDLGDLLLAAYLQDGVGANEGQLLVYFGSEVGVAAAPDQTVVNPTNEPGGRFASAVATADIDGDGRLEAIVGADRQDNPEADEGAAFVFRTSEDGIDAAPSIVLDNPLDQASGHMGVVGGPGDIDGDGYVDFVASPWRQDNPEADEGNACIYFGSPAGVTGPTTLDNPLDQAGGHFGVSTPE